MPPVSICVLLYGDYLELAKRCLGSIIEHCPPDQYRLLVGLNAVGTETRRYVEQLRQSGAIDTVIASEENINKCPMMRLLFEKVETEFIWWFDDDSWIKSPRAFSAWLEKAQNSAPSTMQWGHVFFFSSVKDFSYGNDVVDWVRRAEWFRGEEPPTLHFLHDQVPGVRDLRWFFATGGCWMIRKQAVEILNWPDQRLVKAADDVLLSEAIRQQGWKLEDIGPCGVMINDHSRRGGGEGPETMQRQVNGSGAIQKTRRERPVEVVIVNWKRPENVRRIVEAFAEQAEHCSITLIEAAQDPGDALSKETLALADRHFVFSDNFGSFNRFVPNLSYTAKYTLFHDDDLLPGREAIQHLIACAEQHPDFAVMGEFGRTITSAGKELTGDMPRSGDAPLAVDFLVRTYFVRTENLRHLSAAASALGAKRLGCEDDILLCTSIQQATGCPCLVTKIGRPETSLAYEHLPEPFALWHRTDHFERRAAFIGRRMAEGWKPLESAAPPISAHRLNFKVHSYRRSWNIGDAFQTIALQRLLPSVTYGFRDDGHADDGRPFVVNGWLGNNAPQVENGNCLFAGVFVNDNEDNYRWMANTRYEEIGARDPATVMWCADRSIRATLIGCATLTFERYTGPRSGIYAVDSESEGVEKITHDIGDISWEDQISMAMGLLAKYRRAELVMTSRLHVALPCLAFGTPVVITDPMHWRDPNRVRRFSLLDAIGVRYDEPFTHDVSLWRDRYIRFLERNLGISIGPRPFEALPRLLQHSLVANSANRAGELVRA